MAKTAKVAKKHDKLLTIDFQDRYSDLSEAAVKAVIDLVAACVNAEHVDKDIEMQYGTAKAADHIAMVLETAHAASVPDSVVNTW